MPIWNLLCERMKTNGGQANIEHYEDLKQILGSYYQSFSLPTISRMPYHIFGYFKGHINPLQPRNKWKIPQTLESLSFKLYERDNITFLNPIVLSPWNMVDVSNFHFRVITRVQHAIILTCMYVFIFQT